MTRFKETVSSLAILALLTAAPITADAASEETKPEGEANVEAESSAEGQAAAEGDANMETEAEAAAENETATEGEATAEAEPAGDVEGTIMLQSENTILAGDLIGSSVYNMKDEAIGDINDMIVTLDGKVEGVVIGVGGFLGIGEKNVAIELETISLNADEDASPRLYLDTSVKDLEAAEEFVTAQQQKQREELDEAQKSAEEAADDAMEEGTALE